jgi:hypothetical protein
MLVLFGSFWDATVDLASQPHLILSCYPLSFFQIGASHQHPICTLTFAWIQHDMRVLGSGSRAVGIRSLLLFLHHTS